MMPKTRQPGYMAAFAAYLLAGVGLILLDVTASPLAGFIARVFGGIGQSQVLLILDLLYYLPFFAVPVYLYRRACGAYSLRNEPMGISHFVMCVITACVCLSAVSTILAAWTVLLEVVGLNPVDARIVMEDKGDLIAAIFAMGVLPGVFEELLFRGLILRCCEKMGTKRAVILTAALFTSLHGSVQGLPGELLMGIVLGVIAVTSNSVYPGMIIHTLYNSLTLIINYAVGGARGNAEQSMLESLGGGVGLAMCIFEALLFTGLVLVLLRWFRKHPGGGKMTVIARAKMNIGWGEIVVLCAGILVSVYLYGTNILAMLGCGT